MHRNTQGEKARLPLDTAKINMYRVHVFIKSYQISANAELATSYGILLESVGERTTLLLGATYSQQGVTRFVTICRKESSTFDQFLQSVHIASSDYSKHLLICRDHPANGDR